MNTLLIGLGGIGKKHYKILKKKRNKVFIVDKKLGNLKSLTKETFKNKNFDYAIIATPPNSHLKYAKLMSAFNIPFLLEKPIGHQVNGWSSLINNLKKRNIICGLAYPRRNHIFFDKLKEKIQKGYFGKIKILRSNFSQDFRKYRKDYFKSYYSMKNNGGGVVTDALIHHINLVNFLFKKPVVLYSKVERLVIKNINVEDCAHVYMKYNNDLTASFFSNHFQKQYEDKLEIIGTKGSISIDRNHNKVTYKFGDKRAKNVKVNFNWNKLLLNQITNFENNIKKVGKVKTTLEEGLLDLKICKQILKSVKK